MRAKSHTLMLTQLDSGLPAAWQVWHHLPLQDTQFPSKVLQGWVTLNRRDGQGENQQPLVMHCLFLSHFVLNCWDLSVSSAWAVVVKSNPSPVCQNKLEKTPEHNCLGFLLAVSMCTQTAAHSCPLALRWVACLAAPQRMSKEPQTTSLKARDIRNEESSSSAVESPCGSLQSFRECIVIAGKRMRSLFCLFEELGDENQWVLPRLKASCVCLRGFKRSWAILTLALCLLWGNFCTEQTTDRYIRAILLRTISKNTRLCIQVSGAFNKSNSCKELLSCARFCNAILQWVLVFLPGVGFMSLTHGTPLCRRQDIVVKSQSFWLTGQPYLDLSQKLLGSPCFWFLYLGNGDGNTSLAEMKHVKLLENGRWLWNKILRLSWDCSFQGGDGEMGVFYSSLTSSWDWREGKPSQVDYSSITNL